MSHCLPNPATADGSLAELAVQVGKMMEHPYQSQPNPGPGSPAQPRSIFQKVSYFWLHSFTDSQASCTGITVLSWTYGLTTTYIPSYQSRHIITQIDNYFCLNPQLILIWIWQKQKRKGAGCMSHILVKSIRSDAERFHRISHCEFDPVMMFWLSLDPWAFLFRPL